ncbi:MAG: MBL fold metallo-hydrolase [Thermosulfidibacteraceae bacterium]|jgi:ribonuclease BN (tRNA processing enzyme)
MEIVFLGSAGGRVAVFKQFRSSGGFIVRSEKTNIHIDPGPGALIRLTQIGLKPEETDAFVVSHKHLDHCADINTLIEAKTMGSWNKSGTLLTPESALTEDPIVLRYTLKNLERISILKEDFSEYIKGIRVTVSMKHKHQDVETYGLIFENNGEKLGYITDGRFEEKMIEAYSGCDAIIINMTFIKERDMDHLNMKDAIRLIKGIRPKIAIINHTGMEVILTGYSKVEKELEDATGIKTIVAREFLKVSFPSMEFSKIKLKNPIGIRSLDEWRQEHSKRTDS